MWLLTTGSPFSDFVLTVKERYMELGFTLINKLVEYTQLANL